MRISFNPLAERELNDAAQYYDLESPGLGEALLAEVERSCHAIAEYPEAGPVVLGAIVRRLLRRFLYALLYSLHTDTVRILAVMNRKRRPRADAPPESMTPQLNRWVSIGMSRADVTRSRAVPPKTGKTPKILKGSNPLQVW